MSKTKTVPQVDPFSMQELCRGLYENTLAAFVSGDWQTAQKSIDWLLTRKNPQAVEIFRKALEPVQQTGLLVMLRLFKGSPQDRAEIVKVLEPLVAKDQAEARP